MTEIMVRRVVRLLPGILLIAMIALGAQAHHSFAVHYDTEKFISVTGTVDSFSFANPHGIIRMTVETESGDTEEWRAETNSPNLLKRRGWDKDSIQPGQEITVEGWPARDGSPLIRVASVTLPDGTTLQGQGGAPEE